MKIEISSADRIIVETTGEADRPTGPLVIHISGDLEVSDKSFGEIKEALESGRGAVLPMIEDNGNSVGLFPACAVYNEGDGWVAKFGIASEPNLYKNSLNEGAALSDFPFFCGGIK